jgi:hypothetical protein
VGNTAKAEVYSNGESVKEEERLLGVQETLLGSSPVGFSTEL